MKPNSSPRGALPSIIRNDECLYVGNLVHYFQAVFKNARNLNHPYHNFRHMFHVVWLCYKACEFYKDSLSASRMRNLLIAAMFHDFDHSGLLGDDDLNIARSCRGLEKHILPTDKADLEDIESLIKATEYPYKVPSESLPLRAQIIRDADLSQSLSVAWIQQVIFGLAKEWEQKPIDILRKQIGFFENLKYQTAWAQSLFNGDDIEAKINEVRELLDLLEFSAAPN